MSLSSNICYVTFIVLCVFGTVRTSRALGFSLLLLKLKGFGFALSKMIYSLAVAASAFGKSKQAPLIAKLLIGHLYV